MASENRDDKVVTAALTRGRNSTHPSMPSAPPSNTTISRNITGDTSRGSVMSDKETTGYAHVGTSPQPCVLNYSTHNRLRADSVSGCFNY